MVIPFREEMAKRHLRVTGDLGRIVFVVSDDLFFPLDDIPLYPSLMFSHTYIE